MISLSSLTIIVNCFNSESTLSDTLTNLISSNDSFLVFVVDNCSTDSTLSLASKYSTLNPRVSVFSTPFHYSLGQARNFAISLVNTPFFGFVDSDDLVLKDRFAKQLKTMNLHNSNVSFTNTFSLDNQFRITKMPGYGTVLRDLNTHNFLDAYYPSLSSILFNRQFLLDNFQSSPFNPNYSYIEEYDLIIRISLVSTVLYIPEYLTIWRINHHGLTFSSPQKFLEERLRMYKYYLNNKLVDSFALDTILRDIKNEQIALDIRYFRLLSAFRNDYLYALKHLFKFLLSKIIPSNLYRMLYYLKSKV